MRALDTHWRLWTRRRQILHAWRFARRAIAGAAAGIVAVSVTAGIGATGSITLSVVGTNDLHGRAFGSGNRGGLALFGGYIRNVRAARSADGGGVLLLDAGDTFQGGIESNLSEGGIIVDAYNALGYTAAAIGNHEFDFGPIDEVVPTSGPALAPDPRGALKAMAVRAAYPFLAANLREARTDRPVDWPNVRPSTIVETAGVKVGIVGVMTSEALRSTLSANVRGLQLAPLVDTIGAEARALRENGATVIVVVAHAGGRCSRFDSPLDLSSCERSEIFDVAERLPRGLVDAVVAGHTHAGVAHVVNGIAIVEALSLGQAFSRVDLTVDRSTRRVVGARLFPPQDVCAYQTAQTGACAAGDADSGVVEAQYEGRPVIIDAAITKAMEPALALVRARQATSLGVTLDSRISREGDLESPLGNLFARAVRESMATEVAITSHRFAGLRADLEPGPLTFGRLYDVFPFDDRLIRLSVTGAQLRAIVASDIRRDRRGALSLAGMRVRAACAADALDVQLVRQSGASIADEDRISLATTDLLARSALFASVPDEVRTDVPETASMVREVVAAWLSGRGARLHAVEFIDPRHPSWDMADARISRCGEPAGARSEPGRTR